jgi:GMP synthase (glutamine-hydrolysing)
MILIVDCGSSKVPQIEQMVDEFMDFQTIPILELEEEHLNDKKGIILSGAPILITEVDPGKYLERISWLKTTTLPVLGICFGHQLIGITFGSFGTRIREDRDWQEIESIENSPLFEKLPKTFEMMEDHCETISIPHDFILTAVSDACVNEAMQHKDKPIFGVQFHPEVSGNFGRIIIENFITICEPKPSFD